MRYSTLFFRRSLYPAGQRILAQQRAWNQYALCFSSTAGSTIPVRRVKRGVLKQQQQQQPSTAAPVPEAPPTQANDLDQQIEQPTEQYKSKSDALIESLKKRRLDVAIVGLPNAGKSQLLNMLTASTVSAVSRKRHTTREGVLGARTVVDEKTKEGTQIVFVDTPGFLRHDDARFEGLERQLVVAAPTALRSVDYTLVVVDAARSMDPEKYRATLATLLLQSLASHGREEYTTGLAKVSKIKSLSKFAVVLNKVDLVKPKSALLECADQMNALSTSALQYLTLVPKGGGAKAAKWDISNLKASDLEKAVVPNLEDQLPTFFYTDARKGEGVEPLLNFLLEMATPSNEWPIQDLNATTDQSMEERIAEIIREKLYRCLHREVPYAIDQKNSLLKVSRTEDGDPLVVLIHQDLIVYSKSHATLVRGKNDRMLEKIRETATRDLQEELKCQINLHLHVKMGKTR